METWCTFVFVLVFLITTHKNLKKTQNQSRDLAISGITIAASYVGMLYLDGFVSNGVLNPAVALALGIEGNWQPAYENGFSSNTNNLTLLKSLSPLLGGVLAGLMFIV